MYIEDDYIKEQFIKNFIEASSSNIVIYGVGIHTQRLLENISCDRIIGLMDAKRTGEILWGKKVLSYEEVEKISDVIIVIIARNAVINVIYRRIENFIKKNGIKVFDVNGNDLSISTPTIKEHACFMLDEKELQEKIGRARVVTFDIFDTLLTRWVQRPRDVFSIMDEKLKDRPYQFSSERIKAEQREFVGENATIHQIYKQLQDNLKLTDEERDELLSFEIAEEKKYLHRREYMCQLLDKLVAESKQVYLISDMYFSKDILIDILDSLHITGFTDLFVSCEYKKTKEEGLFEVFLNDTNYSVEECVHIGDNYYADILAPKKMGIATYRIYGTIEMLEHSIYSIALDKCNTLEDNIVLARFAAEAFNNPVGNYHKNGKLIIDTESELINLFIAPIIFKYSIWLVQQLVDGANDYVVFPSRDGYILQKIYQLICSEYPTLNLPTAQYLYTSRRVALVASAKTREDILDILRISDSRTLAEIIKQRFEVMVDDNILWQDISDELLDQLLVRAGEEQTNYKKYIKHLGFYNYNSIAFVDFVAMGTIQKALQKITDVELQGYYFLKRSSDKGLTNEFKFQSLYEVVGDFQANANIYKYYYFLESIVTSYEPSVKFIKSDGKPEFYEDDRDNKTMDMLKRIHSYIFQYSKEMLHSCTDILNFHSSVGMYDTLLGFFSADYSDIGDMEICQIVNTDEFMGKIVTDINR